MNNDTETWFTMEYRDLVFEFLDELHKDDETCKRFITVRPTPESIEQWNSRCTGKERERWLNSEFHNMVISRGERPVPVSPYTPSQALARLWVAAEFPTLPKLNQVPDLMVAFVEGQISQLKNMRSRFPFQSAYAYTEINKQIAGKQAALDAVGKTVWTSPRWAEVSQ